VTITDREELLIITTKWKYFEEKDEHKMDIDDILNLYFE
jgi:hypothetical protein